MFKAADFKNFFSSLFNSYADIFFIRHTFSGCIILLLTLVNYNAGVSGLLSVFSAYIAAMLLGYEARFLSSGFYTYNALLVGLAVGFLFELSPLSLIIIGMAGVFTLILTIVIAEVFYKFFGLQVLSVPFIVISSLVYLSNSNFTNLYVTALYAPTHYLDLNIFPFWLSGYFKSLGAIIFLPNEVAGLILSGLILWYSRILFLLSLSGFIIGIVLYGLFTGSIVSAAADISGFNYILIAMALGGIFNIPSLKSYAIAFFSVGIATIIASAGEVFWSQYNLPIFTLPFTLITLSLIYALSLLDYPLKTRVFQGTPEDNLEYYISNKGRFISEQAAISLPFSGCWYSWQGFDDKWTHQGLFKYAYDFVICDAENKTFKNQGIRLDDYYCYKKEVTSPVNGRIIQVINNLPDNIIGAVDTVNNWGNCIIIQDHRGYYVKIAHLACDSISVFEGQEVSVGTLIGLCGNSGNSPQPHIHIQLQTSIFPTAPTIPFVFVNYEQGGKYHRSGLPMLQANVSHCYFNYYYDQISNFVLDDQYQFEVYYQDKKIDTLDIKVKMDESLYTYFESSKGRLYFGKQFGNFYMYSFSGKDTSLHLFYLALSTMPISYQLNMQWTDTINNGLILNRWQKMISSLLNSLLTGWVKSQSNYHFFSENRIDGKICNDFFDIHLNTSVLLDPVLKFKELHVGDYKLVQIQSSEMKG